MRTSPAPPAFFFPDSAAAQHAGDFTGERRVVLHGGDTLAFLSTLPNGFASLVFTAPPAPALPGRGRPHGEGLWRSLAEQEAVIDQLVRLLHPRGSLCWQVGQVRHDGELLPLDFVYEPLFRRRGLKLRNRIVWSCDPGRDAPPGGGHPRHGTVLWFVKGDAYTFNLDPVRVPQKNPGKRHYKGPNKGKLSCNPLGKNPSDFWECAAQRWEADLWGRSGRELGLLGARRPASRYPFAAVERCVLALSNENDWVLDPYCTPPLALLAGIKHRRRVAGSAGEQRAITAVGDYLAGFADSAPGGEE